MANQITDNRTNINNADSLTNWTGTSTPALDTEIFVQGTGSISENFTNSVRTVLYNMTATQNWANTHFYIWVNCGVVGLLETKANGGFRVRFTGPTTTNFFEVYVGGKDSWPNAIAGGWVQFVVDIEAAASAPSATGGTPPLTSAIQHVGVAGLTTAMTRTTDNTWVDQMWRLPDGTAGIIVEGRNGGTTPWTFANIFTQLGQGSGALKEGPAGSYILNTPLQIGINDSTTCEFSDTNATVFWDNQQYAATDLYGIRLLAGASGVTNLTFGVKTGAGDAAVGSQGVTIQAASAGVRWYFDADDANVDSVDLYGCSFIHGGTFDLDTVAVDLATCLFLDCDKAHVNGANIVRATVVDANTADGVAFMTSADMSNIVFSSFSFSDGHAIELLTPRVASQDSVGNTFSGYGSTTSNDAAVYNNAGGAVTINVLDGGTSPTYRDGASASTSIVAGSVTATLIVTDVNGAAIQNARVLIKAAAGGPLPDDDTVTITNSGATATVAHTGHGMDTGDKVLIKGASLAANNGVYTITVTNANQYTYAMGSSPGSNPTGTIKATYVLLDGLTSVAGQVSISRVFASDQPVTGWARKSSAAPYFKTAPVSGTVSSGAGATLSAVLVADE